MQFVKTTFQDRLADIESYFELVKNIELALGNGGAAFEVNKVRYNVTPDQQKIMYSGIYLQLYNLIESTMNLLVEAVERHASTDINGDVSLLSEKMTELYVKSVTLPHDETLSYEKKLEYSLLLLKQALRQEPSNVKIHSGGGGNWDYEGIEKISKTIGVSLVIPQSVKAKIFLEVRNGKRPLRLIKEIRNDLAHGSISFKECGDNHVASEFRRLIDVVKDVLTHIINSYEKYIAEKTFRRQP